MTSADLNRQFGIPAQVEFMDGPGGFPLARISNRHATAEVCLYGGHVLRYQPQGQPPVLWLSRCSRFEEGKPIRGGIPVCWPWFGAHPTDPALPMHGLARISQWDIRATSTQSDGATAIKLGLTDSPDSCRHWPYSFELELTAIIGPRLRVELAMHNRAAAAVRITAALHSYFAVSRAQDIVIHGLEDKEYIDTVGQPWQRRRQSGSIRIAEETDRIYLDTAADCVLDDPGLRRRITIAKEGSRTTVVWNPWIEKSKRMPDFGDDEYPGMVCIETANAQNDAITLPPGGRHTLAAIIGSEPLG
jgi:D-hexose-6-phosphate mutarotase